ncbi:MAG: MazG family protein [Candidatus Nanopelagicales bacterium]|nr:MazG family protein [Candidatus Nanopelagicales bacterium]
MTTKSHLAELIAVMDRLRSPGGCPWDAEQTHESLIEYLVEETYETVEAIELQDREALREELGDVLLQVVFHARIAQEHPTDPWDIDDVAAGIVAKLIRRHPHVFLEGEQPDANLNWHERKAKEKGRESVTDGIPAHLPALLLAAKVLARSRRLAEQVPVTAQRTRAEEVAGHLHSEAELGDLLLELTSLARDRGWDGESALRGAVQRRVSQVRRLEGLDR